MRRIHILLTDQVWSKQMKSPIRRLFLSMMIICLLANFALAEFRLGICVNTFPGMTTNTITCAGVDWSGCGSCAGSLFLQVSQDACDSRDETLCQQVPRDIAYSYPNVNATGIFGGSCCPYLGLGCMPNMAKKTTIGAGTGWGCN